MSQSPSHDRSTAVNERQAANVVDEVRTGSDLQTAPLAARKRRMQRLELGHAAIAFVVCGVAMMLASTEVVRGLAVGFLLGGLNARALSVLVGRATSGEAGAQFGASALMLGKMMLMLLAVGAALLLLDVQPLAMLVAISLAPAILLVGSLLGGYDGAPQASEVQR